jgi:hypothetical protein
LISLAKHLGWQKSSSRNTISWQARPVPVLSRAQVSNRFLRKCAIFHSHIAYPDSYSDLINYCALKHLQSEKGSSANISTSTTYWKIQGAFSGGTIQSLYAIAEEASRAADDGEWCLVSRECNLVPRAHCVKPSARPLLLDPSIARLIPHYLEL